MDKDTKQKYLTGNLLVDGLFIGSIVTALFLYGYLDGTGKFWPATQWSITAGWLTGKNAGIVIYNTDGKIGKYEHRIAVVAKLLQVKFLLR